jgi:hypothetical protein
MPPKVTAQVPGEKPAANAATDNPAAAGANAKAGGDSSALAGGVATGTGKAADGGAAAGASESKDALKMIEITEDELRIALLVVQAHNRGETHFDPTAEPEVVSAEDLGLPVESQTAAAAVPASNLPDAADIDPTKITRSVLTKQGWVAPHRPDVKPA